MHLNKVTLVLAAVLLAVAIGLRSIAGNDPKQQIFVEEVTEPSAPHSIHRFRYRREEDLHDTSKTTTQGSVEHHCS